MKQNELDLKIEQWPVARLVAYARNARTHSEGQVAQVAASIAQFGFVNPILVGPDRVIIAGHARLLAARQLEMSEVVSGGGRGGHFGGASGDHAANPPWR